MDPFEEFQKLIVDTLKADPTVAGFVADRVYDAAPQDVVFPYCELGPANMLPLDADCIVQAEQSRQVDIWSRGGGQVANGRICDAARTALTNVPLDSMTDNALQTTLSVTYRVLRDPDGSTYHGVVDVTANIQEL